MTKRRLRKRDTASASSSSHHPALLNQASAREHGMGTERHLPRLAGPPSNGPSLRLSQEEARHDQRDPRHVRDQEKYDKQCKQEWPALANVMTDFHLGD